jgi:hypothetical protein
METGGKSAGERWSSMSCLLPVLILVVLTGLVFLFFSSEILRFFFSLFRWQTSISG